MTEEEFIMLRLKSFHIILCARTFKVTFSAFHTNSWWEVHLSWMAVWWDGLLHPCHLEAVMHPCPYCLPISYDVSSYSYARVSQLLTHSFTLQLQQPRMCIIFMKALLPLTLSFTLVGQKLGLKVETDHSGTFADLMCINVGADFIFPSRSALICFTLCTWLILQKCTMF